MSATPTPGHPPEHDELLADVLAGLCERGDARVVARLRECAQCARELAVLELLQGGLRMDAAETARELAAAVADPHAAGAVEVDAYLRARFAERAASAPRPRATNPLARIAAFAALVLAVFGIAWWWNRSRAPLGGGDVQLGGRQKLELLAPLGRVERFDEFRWNGELETGAWFTLTIHASAPPNGGTDDAVPLVGPLRVETTRYTVDAQALPAAIRWEVRQFDSSGGFVQSASADAQRSPP